MPSRIVCIAIVLVWLGFNGWLFFHELLPRLLPGQPPPYTIDLVEETRTRRPYVEWNVEHDGRRAFRAKTYVDHPAHDVFELVAEFKKADSAAPPPIHGLRVNSMSSTYRVSTAGDLLGVAVRIEGQPQLARALKLIAGDFTATINGEVENGRLAPRLKLELPGKTFERDLGAVTIPSGGSVLLLHPVNRVLGISLGQSWTLRVFDPIAGSLGVLGGGGELQSLRAKVRPRLETFSYGKRNDVECLVIDYEGDDMKASTWVAKERGLVLCQEATLDGGKWAMYRE
jgi:hypothetical protein